MQACINEQLQPPVNSFSGENGSRANRMRSEGLSRLSLTGWAAESPTMHTAAPCHQCAEETAAADRITFFHFSPSFGFWCFRAGGQYIREWSTNGIVKPVRWTRRLLIELGPPSVPGDGKERKNP
ncbi:hypothetical protein EMCG_05281 [[Emmonsia] crescens]|uniref:Uncharacterized protein n=1 Tax=[Emmonsia] crescens TaxID=73230 RepID=A0A0G2HQI2_9EURO|nr:hypothetical protein EMCG_05281 [Emmonsia crescens UAMH 3008]